MDEAFKSRIHLSLYYPPLTLERTLSIFEVNLRRLRVMEAGRNTAMDANPDSPKRSRLSINDNSILDYAKWHFEENEFTPEQRWNGRQIRNAFQLAYSLAHFDMETLSLDRWDDEDEDDDNNTATAAKTPARPLAQTLLDYKQFEMVARSMQMFEDYLIQTTGGTEMEKTAARQTRADDFDHHQAERQQTSYQPRPRHRGGSYAPRDNTSYGPRSSRAQHSTYQPPTSTQRRPTHHQQQQPPTRGPTQRQQRPQQRHLEIPNNGGRAAYHPPPSYSPGRDRQPSPRLSPAGRGGVVVAVVLGRDTRRGVMAGSGLGRMGVVIWGLVRRGVMRTRSKVGGMSWRMRWRGRCFDVVVCPQTGALIAMYPGT